MRVLKNKNYWYVTGELIHIVIPLMEKHFPRLKVQLLIETEIETSAIFTKIYRTPIDGVCSQTLTKRIHKNEKSVIRFVCLLYIWSWIKNSLQFWTKNTWIPNFHLTTHHFNTTSTPLHLINTFFPTCLSIGNVKTISTISQRHVRGINTGICPHAPANKGQKTLFPEWLEGCGSQAPFRRGR